MPFEAAETASKPGSNDNAGPRVSVLVMTYNHERFIQEAIESALMQETNFLYEIVVGEDFSTDRTREILQDYKARYPEKIRLLLHPKNLGGAPNFILTLGGCRGDYIAFLEGDDYWTSTDKLRLQASFLDEHADCALCHHRVSYLDEATGEIVAEFPLPQRRMQRTTGSELVSGNFIQTCSLMIRRKAIPRLRKDFAKLKLGDWPICVLSSQNGWIGYIDQNMAVYRLHAGSAWSAQNVDYRDTATRQMVRFMALGLSRKHRGPWGAWFLRNLQSELSLKSQSGNIRSTAWTGAVLVWYGIRLNLVRAPLLFYYATRLLAGAAKRRLVMLWHSFRHDGVSTATHPQ